MEITVIYNKTKQKKEIQENSTIKEMLDLMDISSETVVVKRNNEIVMDEEKLHNKDVIEVIRVIYGG
ncbi:MAG: MoaD/ThiS family protein [Methanobacteriaceae archaeon]|jgi:sulfur carrier protein